MSASELLPFDVNAFLLALRGTGCSMGEPFHYFSTTTSTNDEAKRLADSKAPHGTTCFADFQSHGRGRQGKLWSAQPHAQILASVLLRQPHPATNAAVTLVVGVALHRALKSVLPGEQSLLIKWPNDIEARGRKLAGILTESHSNSDATIVGFGVNVWEPPAADTEPMQPSALRTLGCGVGREQVLVTLLKAVEEAWLSFQQAGLLPFVTYLNQHDALLGSAVRIGDIEGRAAGVTSDGALLLDTVEGKRAIYSGTLERIGHE